MFKLNICSWIIITFLKVTNWRPSQALLPLCGVLGLKEFHMECDRQETIPVGS